MDILISNSSGKPIYEQITSQIKNLILSGGLQAGEALPSMRLLAKELRISVITTKRAYEDLERDGFIETVPGKGSFVAHKNAEGAFPYGGRVDTESGGYREIQRYQSTGAVRYAEFTV